MPIQRVTKKHVNRRLTLLRQTPFNTRQINVVIDRVTSDGMFETTFREGGDTYSYYIFEWEVMYDQGPDA